MKKVSKKNAGGFAGKWLESAFKSGNKRMSKSLAAKGKKRK